MRVYVASVADKPTSLNVLQRPVLQFQHSRTIQHLLVGMSESQNVRPPNTTRGVRGGMVPGKIKNNSLK